jgi:hypothetical protein
MAGEIESAARRQDLEEAQRVANRAAELKILSSQLRELSERIETFLSPTPRSATSTNGSGATLRRLPVQVTGGMIRQRLLLITEHVRHGKVSPGYEFHIQVPASGETFRTQLLNDYKLRERGGIGRFYQVAHVQEGDVVILIETTPNKWTLEKAQPGEWDGHYRYKRVRAV